MREKLENKLKRNIPLDYISAFIMNLNMQNSIWVLYLTYCGLNLAEIDIMEGIYHATSIVCEIPSGAVADLLGRKRSMVLSRICTAVSCMVMLCAKSFWLFAISFIIQALGNNLNSGSEEALVYDSIKYMGQEERYLNVCGKLDVIVEISQGISTVLGGILAEYSYFWCYGACLVIALLALFPVFLMTEVPCTDSEQKPETVTKVVVQHFKTSFEILQSDCCIFKIIFYYSVIFATETLLFFYSQQYYFELGYNKIFISLILLAVGGASCLGAVMSGRLFQKWGKKVVAFASFVIALALMCYGFGNIVVSVVAFASAGFFNSMLYPIQLDALNQRIPSKQRATLISVNSMFFSVAMIVMFPLAGAMADYWGLRKVLTAIGLALLIVILYWRLAEKEAVSMNE